MQSRVVFTGATLACWIPARRASRIDPMVALRYELRARLRGTVLEPETNVPLDLHGIPARSFTVQGRVRTIK